MRIVMMGTGGFCIPSFHELFRSGHEIVALITMPLRTRRHGEKAGIPPIRQVAQTYQIPMYEPENINSDEGIALLKQLNADLIFVCDYGKILSSDVIATVPHGGVNLHGSLLPRYRGAAPINRAILNGDTEIGVSVIHITPEVDAGPVIAMGSYQPTQQDTAIEIEEALSQMGAPLVLKAIDQLETGSAEVIPQDPDLASKAPKIKKEEGRIDWTSPAPQIVNQYRAFQPWPKTFSDWHKSSPTATPLRLILGPLEWMDKWSVAPIKPVDADHSVCGSSQERAQIDQENAASVSATSPLEPSAAPKFSSKDSAINSKSADISSHSENTSEINDRPSFKTQPGMIVGVERDAFFVQTGDGIIRVTGVQPAGKKQMSVEVFLRGYPMKPGDFFEI